MKHKRLLLMLLTFSLILLISACGDDDNGGTTGLPDITPGSYDWEVYFINYSEMFAKTDEYRVMVEWLGDSAAISGTDDYSLVIDGETHPLQGVNLFGTWLFSGYTSMQAGELYDIKFYKNDSLISSADLRLPYKAEIQLPANYDPSSATSLEWSLESDSDFQTLSVISYDEEEYDQEDEWERLIPSSARSYIIPANAVMDFGPDTTYELMLIQLNFKKSGRTAYLAGSVEGEIYGNGIPANAVFDEVQKLARKIIY
jgi:hypothetical protein